jgi:hypothetical protein
VILFLHIAVEHKADASPSRVDLYRVFSFYAVFEKPWRDPQRYLEGRLTEAAYKAARYVHGRRKRRSGWHVVGRLYSNEVKNTLLYGMWMRCLG